MQLQLSEAYQTLLHAASISSNQSSSTTLNSAIKKLGMTKCRAVDPKFIAFNDAYELNSGNERLYIQYRYYDTSGPFSLQPDMNVYLIRHSLSGQLISEKEIKYLDASVY